MPILPGILLFAAMAGGPVGDTDYCLSLPLSPPGRPYSGVGASVAIAGDLAVIGAPLDDVLFDDDGSVSLYSRSESGWTFIRKLTGSAASDGTEFGYSVAIDGDLLVVGSRCGDVVHVFRKQETTWVEEAVLTPSVAGGLFGWSVAVDNETIVVGDPFGNTFCGFCGSFSVYEFDGSRWALTATFGAADPESFDFYGISVAIDGDVVVVGKPKTIVPFAIGPGAAYVFVRGDQGWAYATTLEPSESSVGDQYGISCDVRGGYALVGVPHAHGETNWAGAAFLFEATEGKNWVEVQKLTASDGMGSDHFGWSVSLTNGYAVIGAMRSGLDGALSVGSAYLFAGDCDTFVEHSKITGTSEGDRLGWSVDINGRVVIAGIPGFGKEGAAQVYGPCNLNDIDQDGVVGVGDLLVVLGSWGVCPQVLCPCLADINADGIVNESDLLAIVAGWGNGIGP